MNKKVLFIGSSQQRARSVVEVVSGQMPGAEVITITNMDIGGTPNYIWPEYDLVIVDFPNLNFKAGYEINMRATDRCCAQLLIPLIILAEEEDAKSCVTFGEGPPAAGEPSAPFRYTCKIGELDSTLLLLDKFMQFAPREVGLGHVLCTILRGEQAYGFGLIQTGGPGEFHLAARERGDYAEFSIRILFEEQYAKFSNKIVDLLATALDALCEEGDRGSLKNLEHPGTIQYIILGRPDLPNGFKIWHPKDHIGLQFELISGSEVSVTLRTLKQSTTFTVLRSDLSEIASRFRSVTRLLIP